jgi:hypothetical protein
MDDVPAEAFNRQGIRSDNITPKISQAEILE